MLYSALIPFRNLIPFITLSAIFWSSIASGQDPADRVFPGADETTPSRAFFFDWINSQYEGSTEAQTLVNLDFFKWLHDEYGMKLDIYSLDVGNLDDGPYTAGVGRLNPHHFGNLDSADFKTQFPRGFGPPAKAAAAFGCRLGVWLGPDGFGDTPEEERRRQELLVSVCRDHRFMLLKLDTVAGDLRPEKQDALIEALKACRVHCPDLIVLSERVSMGRAEPYFTTHLWEGVETYIDVFSWNRCTAPHQRAGALERPATPGLTRLIEDHGVCLSSGLDFWEDDLCASGFPPKHDPSARDLRQSLAPAGRRVSEAGPLGESPSTLRQDPGPCPPAA